MERLCGRPGCSESAAVAYGMVPTDLVFWLAPLPFDPDPDGVLCRRHADAMVVPRGWTLDDRRDPDLHLFRPPTPSPAAPLPRRRRSRRESLDAEQLELGAAVVAAAADAAIADERVGGDTLEPVDVPEGHAAEVGEPVAEPVAADPAPWSPTFDESDDLDGLLSARSPLLSRAFRTADPDGR